MKEETSDILTIAGYDEPHTVEMQRGRTEHLDMAVKIKMEITYTKYTKVMEERVKRNIKKLKKDMAAGPDGMKPYFCMGLEASSVYKKLNGT
ncbi:hypothetical protein SK128_018890, partial [Halocaridina rubra]